MNRRFALALVLAGTPLCLAQIQWLTDPQQAIAQAQRTRKPLMVYCLGATKDRDDDLQSAQDQALASPLVMRLAQNFVPLKLSRSANRENLKDFGLPDHANMMMSFVTPDGKVLGDLSGPGIAQAESLARKLELTLEEYTREFYKADIQPVLTRPEAPPAEIKAALKMVTDLGIKSADKDVLALLERPNLDPGVQAAVYTAAARLSTPAAVEKLIERMEAGDADALKALELCSPAAAEPLLAALQKGAFRYELYEALVKVCDIRNKKPKSFFERDTEQARKLQVQEVERVTKLAQQAAQAAKGQTDAR